MEARLPVKIDPSKVRRARERRGHTLETAANAAGVAKGTVFRAEHSNVAYPSTMKKLAEAYGVQIAELMPDEVEASPKASAPDAQPSLFEATQQDRRKPTLEEIKAIYAPLAAALNGVCGLWEQRIAAGEVDGVAAKFFAEDAQHHLTPFTIAKEGELDALAEALGLDSEDHPYRALEHDPAVGFTRGELEEKSQMHAALQRYEALVAQLTQLDRAPSSEQETPTTAA